jgi:hypothetical protein
MINSGEKTTAPRCMRPPKLHAILGDQCSSSPSARMSASRHTKTTRATKIPPQNETTARTNDAMPVATFGSPPDEDTRINLREPKSERSVVTATNGNRATPYHHELDIASVEKEMVVTRRCVACQKHQWCGVRFRFFHPRLLAMHDSVDRRRRRDHSVRPASRRSGRRALRRRPLLLT